MNYEHTCPEFVFNMLKEGKANSELIISDEFTEKYSKGDEIKIINSSNQNQSLTRIIEKEATFSSFTDYKTKLKDIKLNINAKSFYNLESLSNNIYQTYLIGVEYKNDIVNSKLKKNSCNQKNIVKKQIKKTKIELLKERLTNEKNVWGNVRYSVKTKDMIKELFEIYDGNASILSKDINLSSKVISNLFKEVRKTNYIKKEKTLESYLYDRFDTTYENLKTRDHRVIYDSFEKLTPKHNFFLGLVSIKGKTSKEIAKEFDFQDSSIRGILNHARKQITSILEKELQFYKYNVKREYGLEEINKLILNDLNKGKSRVELATKYKVKQHIVRLIANKHNIQRTIDRKSISNCLYAKIKNNLKNCNCNHNDIEIFTKDAIKQLSKKENEFIKEYFIDKMELKNINKKFINNNRPFMRESIINKLYRKYLNVNKE